jgi:asparagine synthase (glutamine-hydrolysing)
MCGICGISWTDKDLIKLMGSACKHRGPEHEGFYVDDHVSLCCERLRIIDLSDKASQPIHNEDQSIWVVLNGEIYNFVELRRELEALGHRFKSESDTEVILASYVQWGEKCQFRFNGMWAFAIWDSQERVLFLSRDRFGVKPVFFMFDGRHFVFASELKAFLALKSPMRPEFDSGMVALLANRENIEKSLLKNVKNLNGGHRLILKGGGTPFKFFTFFSKLFSIFSRFANNATIPLSNSGLMGLFNAKNAFNSEAKTKCRPSNIKKTGFTPNRSLDRNSTLSCESQIANAHIPLNLNWHFSPH